MSNTMTGFFIIPFLPVLKATIQKQNRIVKLFRSNFKFRILRVGVLPSPVRISSKSNSSRVKRTCQEARRHRTSSYISREAVQIKVLL